MTPLLHSPLLEVGVVRPLICDALRPTSRRPLSGSQGRVGSEYQQDFCRLNIKHIQIEYRPRSDLWYALSTPVVAILLLAPVLCLLRPALA